MAAVGAPLSRTEVRAHAAALARLAHSLLRGDTAAEDVVQDTWLAAARRRPPERLGRGGWLTVVLRNFVRKRHVVERRRRERERATSETASPAVAPPDQFLEESEMLQRLTRALGSLDEPYGSTVRLCYMEGLSPSQLAQQQGLAAATVRSRLKRGLAQIRSSLDAEDAGRRPGWRALLFPYAALPRRRPILGPFAKGAAVLAIPVVMSSSIYLSVRERSAPLAKEEGLVPADEPARSRATSGPRAARLPALWPGQPATAPPGWTELFNFDFEGGYVPPLLAGRLVEDPAASVGRRCVTGTVWPSWPKAYMVWIGSPGTPLFHYDESGVLSFDYWVGDDFRDEEGEQWSIGITVHSSEEGLKYDTWIRSYPTEQWSHAVLRLSDFYSKGPSSRPARNGDRFDRLQIVGGLAGGKPFHVDNIKLVARPR